MAKSSIPKLPDLRANSEFSRTLGRAVRERRRARGLTQTQLGDPFTKGFVSEVERGRALPSLRALVYLATRLEVPLADLLGEVKTELPLVYTQSDDNAHTPSAAGHG